MFPALSIITPSFNQGPFLEETICSVLDQNIDRLEYIIIDGGSTDSTLDVIKKYKEHIAYWVSEPDEGQPHAINKGIAKATGDIVGYLNSDDLYLPGALVRVGEYFQGNPGADWICGDTEMFGEGVTPEVVKTRVPLSVGHCLAWAYKAPQPGMFWRRNLLDAGFNNRWRYCFDHELYLRLLIGGYHCEHISQTLARYRLHSTSKTVAEGDGFGAEFDEIARLYEPKVETSARRWSIATRLLRQSYVASGGGDRSGASSMLFKALVTHPEIIADRPFWGCLRGIIAGSESRNSL